MLVTTNLTTGRDISGQDVNVSTNNLFAFNFY